MRTTEKEQHAHSGLCAGLAVSSAVEIRVAASCGVLGTDSQASLTLAEVHFFYWKLGGKKINQI